MLKLDNNAFRAFWYMLEWPVKIVVPIVAVVSLVTGGDVFGNVIVAFAICVAPVLTIWVIGMVFDLLMLCLKVVCWAIITLIRMTIVSLRRRPTAFESLPAYSGPKDRQG